MTKPKFQMFDIWILTFGVSLFSILMLCMTCIVHVVSCTMIFHLNPETLEPLDPIFLS